MQHFLDPENRESKFECTPPKPLPEPIPPVEPRSGSADTELSRQVGYILPLTNNSRINPFNPKTAKIEIDSTVSPPIRTPPSTRLCE